MMVTPRAFALHLDVIKQYFTPVSLSDWLNRARTGQALPKMACAVTFDDGWRDNYEHAFPLLKAAGVPGTIFLVSDKVGTTERFWPERLAQLLWHGGNGLPASTLSSREFSWLGQLLDVQQLVGGPPRREAIDTVVRLSKRYSDAEIQQRLRAMESVVGVTEDAGRPDLLNWSQVKEMEQSGLVTFGSHTRNHLRLGDNVEARLLTDEVHGSRAVIEKHTQRAADVFCYPNGDFTPSITRLVKDHYTGACTTRRGWNVRGTDPFLLQRVGVHEDVAYDRISFISRIAGV
jgi:peptidoglycan/xylan/chitin deacetylase (PgdA/CDA1 family)